MSGGWGALAAAEWRKVATTKMVWILTFVAVALAAATTVPSVLVASGTIPSGNAGGPSLEGQLLNPDYLVTLLASAASGAMFALILGVIAMTSEYRHMTITATFLAEPRRNRVVVAKMAVFAVLGAVMAVVVVAAVAIAVFVTMIPFDHAPLTASIVGQVLLGAVIGFALYAILGVSVGALLRNQIAAIIVVVVWTLIVEQLIAGFFPVVGKWLPSGALNSAMDVGLTADFSGGVTATNNLPVWGGIALLLAYAAVFAIVASLTTTRRDIT